LVITGEKVLVKVFVGVMLLVGVGVEVPVQVYPGKPQGVLVPVKVGVLVGVGKAGVSGMTTFFRQAGIMALMPMNIKMSAAPYFRVINSSMAS
jgi:hypothetical protein